MPYNIIIFFDSATGKQIQGGFVDFISSIPANSEYKISVADGFKIIPNTNGYLFALVDETKGVYHFFLQLDENTALQTLKNTITSILNGRYTFEGDKVFDTLGGGRQVSTRDLEIGNYQNGGGILPFDIMPQWIQDLLKSLGLDGIRLPWWLFASLSAYGATKLVQKDSNKIIWGLITTFSSIAAVKAYKNK